MLSNLFEASLYNKKKKTKANKKTVYQKNNNYVKIKLCSLCERIVAVSINVTVSSNPFSWMSTDFHLCFVLRMSTQRTGFVFYISVLTL